MADTELIFKVDGAAIKTNDAVLSGRQIRESAGLSPASDYILIKVGEGSGQSIGLDETIDLRINEQPSFISFCSDRVYHFTVNERGFEWGADKITVSDLRKYADISDSETLFLERIDAPDKQLTNDGSIQLASKGVERISSRKPFWKLNVQGVLLTLTTPMVVVKDALAQAGFDPDKGWIAILKRKGEAKLQVALTDTIDLTHPGIEKLRLTPAQINNGEALSAPRREFVLLEKDEAYLNERGLVWETYVEGGRRWLLLRNFILPEGFNHAVIDIAIDIPPTYPRSEIDMFHCFPYLTLKSGATIGETSGRTDISGQTYQQWSRHLNGQTRWNPATDSVMTHVAVIEASLLKEVGE